MMNENETPSCIQKNRDVKHLSTYNTGGTVEFLAEVESREQLQEVLRYALQHEIPYTILGGGSNIVFPDEHYHGMLIQIRLHELMIDKEQAIVKAEAGVPFARIVKETIHAGLQGLEWAAGVPGTVGGAIRGNAGCFNGETKDHLLAIETFHIQNKKIYNETIEAVNAEMSYRESRFKHDVSYIILAATWQLQKGNPESLQETYQQHLARKRGTQPLGHHSAGSFFKGIEIETLNEQTKEKLKKYEKFVKNGIMPASLLIDKELHMKGYSIGGAQVSEKHAGFIINNGNATSKDILSIATEIEHRMKQQLGISLEREVVVI